MKLLGLLFLTAFMGGCVTQMTGSAPAATPGRAYVVGGSSGEHAIWLCPTQGSDEKCSVVEIQE